MGTYPQKAFQSLGRPPTGHHYDRKHVSSRFAGRPHYGVYVENDMDARRLLYLVEKVGDEKIHWERIVSMILTVLCKFQTQQTEMNLLKIASETQIAQYISSRWKAWPCR